MQKDRSIRRRYLSVMACGLAIGVTFVAVAYAAPTQYLLFFPFRSATPEFGVDAVMAEVARVCQQSRKIIVTGYTDTCEVEEAEAKLVGEDGDCAYTEAEEESPEFTAFMAKVNASRIRLSTQRAEAVKKLLVARGMPAARIVTTGKADSKLIVQTSFGVREPQNRRASVECE